MKIRLAYGKEGLDVEVPEKNLLKVLAIDPVRVIERPEEAIAHALRAPVNSPSLGELAKKAKSACIVVCDITRPVPNKLLLPPVLRVLEESGIDRSRITILLATGLHRPSTAEEREIILGESVARMYQVVDHRASVREEQAFLGTTQRKTPIFIDARYVNADLKITVGFIEPHLMAGFSGGRKMVAIGCAGEDTIKTLHSPLFLDDPRCAEGSIDENPLHHELLEIAWMAGHDFTIDVSLDANRQITGVFAGHPVEAHAAGVKAVRRFVRSTVPEPADIVVTTSAGFPLDLTYYQAIKGMTSALPILKQGGTLILAAACTEGLGSETFRSMATAFKSADAFDSWIHNNPVEVDQWQLQECVKAIRRGEVVVVSDGIPADERSKLFVKSAASVEEALGQAMKKHGQDARIAVVPKGPYTLVEVESSPV